MNRETLASFHLLGNLPEENDMLMMADKLELLTDCTRVIDRQRILVIFTDIPSRSQSLDVFNFDVILRIIPGVTDGKSREPSESLTFLSICGGVKCDMILLNKALSKSKQFRDLRADNRISGAAN